MQRPKYANKILLYRICDMGAESNPKQISYEEKRAVNDDSTRRLTDKIVKFMIKSHPNTAHTKHDK